MNRVLSALLAGLLILCVGQTILLAQRPGPKPKRAEPPRFSKSTQDSFLENIYKQALKGDRPTGGIASSGPSTATQTPASANPGGSSGKPAAAGAWASVVSAEVLEDEIKRLKTAFEETISTPGKFKGGEYKKTRLALGQLAIVFGIIAEYDGNVRFKKDAMVARNNFARAADVCKAGSDGTYATAKLAGQTLQDLISGQSPQAIEGSANIADWKEVANRNLIMQRYRDGYKEKLASWTANEKEFKANKDGLLAEVEIMGAMAAALKKPGMTDAGDAEYDKYCDLMSGACKTISESIKNPNYDNARKAVGDIDKSCSGCHEHFR